MSDDLAPEDRACPRCGQPRRSPTHAGCFPVHALAVLNQIRQRARAQRAGADADRR